MNVTSHKTFMAAEIASIPDLIDAFLKTNRENAQKTGAQLRQLEPNIITTIARGSSDHAATYLKYVIEMTIGIPVSSTGPSVSSIYNASLILPNALSFAISQSGKSPDIVLSAKAAKSGGSSLISLTNDATSPLAKLAHYPINIGAGLEQSVAATKTFVMSIVAGLMIIAHWRLDQTLLDALKQLPEEIEQATQCDWSCLSDHIYSKRCAKHSLYVLGRGPSFAIANECALKFKETCQLHAEAYSAAEVVHGPISIAQEGFTVLALASNDASRPSLLDTSEKLIEQGVDVFITGKGVKGTHSLQSVSSAHKLTDPLLQIGCFYTFIEKLSRRLGLNPDEPPYLRKVTKTI